MSNNKEITLSLDQQLLKAAGHATPEVIRDLLKRGANPAYEFYEEGTWGAYERESCIHTALRRKLYDYDENQTEEDRLRIFKERFAVLVEVVEILLTAGAKVNAVRASYNWKGSGASETGFQIGLELALQADNPDLLRLLLKHGGDPNVIIKSEAHTMRYDGGESNYPIHTAAQGGQLSCLQVLLNAGAKVDVWQEKHGHSEWGNALNTKENALHLACLVAEDKEADRHCEIVATLIKAGINVNAVRKYLANVDNDEIKERNRQNGGEDPRDGIWECPIEHFPVEETCLHIALKREQVKLVYMLLTAGANVFIPYKYGNKEIPTWELTKDKECQKALQKVWTPANHSLHPKRTRERIQTLFLVSKRLNWSLPKYVLYQVCQFLAYDDML